jgi:hypothetical protein
MPGLFVISNYENKTVNQIYINIINYFVVIVTLQII